MAKVILDTARLIEIDESRRLEIALGKGVTLLRSPTGSGKTLTIGRTLEALVGKLPRKTIWLWFTPYTGLVAQTQDALASQCPRLRLRDPITDRNLDHTRDGDVFVMTWQSVASEDQAARRVRKAKETMPGLDAFLDALAGSWYSDFRIGVVIDEAHLNFGMGAPQAASFYRDVVNPDFTILATATPKDGELARFARAVGMGTPNRVDVSRERVVRSCLNKVGITAFYFRPDAKDERTLDMDEVAVWAGIQRHLAVKKALVESGINLVPLLLIQAENVAEGGENSIAKILNVLKQNGFSSGTPGSPVAVHTSGQPDPFFHTIAYDETKEVLVFKMSAATGFDAPRAWTLVSLRRTIGPEFGLQLLGRIMRVHSSLQPFHPYALKPPRLDLNILDRGYVFLAKPDQQLGLVQAAQDLKMLRDAATTVTDDVVVVEVSGTQALILNPETGFAELLGPLQAAVKGIAFKAQADQQSEAAGSSVRAIALRANGLFDELQIGSKHTASWGLGDAHTSQAKNTKRGFIAYRMRTDISFPRALAREVMPKTMDNLVGCIARRIVFDGDAIALMQKTLGKVLVTEEDVFEETRTIEGAWVPISAARIALGAQRAFRFNESIEERDLKPAIRDQLKKELTRRGSPAKDESDLRRCVDLLAMARPNLLIDSCRACLATETRILQDEEIPEKYYGPPNLPRALKSLYGVFPHELNLEEIAFARLLDEDTTGTVLWWLRNVSQSSWAVSIVLPSGERHFPDFVVGVDPRRTVPDHIALAEIKDDGTTGRLFSERNSEKVRTEHQIYRSCLMVFRNKENDWFNVAYRADLQRHQAGGRFTIEDLVRTS